MTVVIIEYFPARTVFRANCRSFLFNLCLIIFGLGPKIEPPPLHKGERLEPALARPVPF